MVGVAYILYATSCSRLDEEWLIMVGVAYTICYIM